MSNKPIKKKIFFKAVLSAAFFIVLFSFLSGNELFAVFSQVNYFFLFLSFCLAFIMLAISCLKWKVILDTSGQHIPFIVLMRIYLIGYFFSNLFPSTVGGDLPRSYYAGKLINNQAYAAASVFLERFTGMVLLVLLVVVAPLQYPVLYLRPVLYVPSFIACCLLLFFLWLWKASQPLVILDKLVQYVFSLLSRWSKKNGVTCLDRGVVVLEQLYRKIMQKVERFSIELHNSSLTIKRNKGVFFRIIFLTIAFYFLTWVNVYVSFRAFNVHPDFLAISALVPTIMFVSHLPVTLLGNLGFFESVFVYYFLLLDIPVAETLAMGLLLRLKMLCLGLFGFFLYLIEKQKVPVEQLNQ